MAVEWSGLHGIAEIKTPVLKISARTDATAQKYTVRWSGTGYPDEGATGLRFPYRAPARKPMAEGRRFRRALEVSVEQEWAGQQPNSQKMIGQGPVPARAWFDSTTVSRPVWPWMTSIARSWLLRSRY